ncbi:M23 family metallopeptidase [Microbacterium sp. NPDC056234]|uniref:M23 family metallopeptidase n=1 Tax=Microbacterium sp. NPDC056234 TaxID=3345757 RepID=UPI0035E1FE12
MKRLLAILAVLALLTSPAAAMLAVGLMMNPAVASSCVAGSLTVTVIPDSLTATTKDGDEITLDRTQLTRAATIITTAGQTDGVGRDGALIALMAALTESRLRMLANAAHPESLTLPNDGTGADHDSLGLFQMRPSTGWGTVAELMDASYQARAFYGGPDGPNFPSPRGLLDIPGWQNMDPGEVAQAVEVSAFPTRYQNYQPVAEAILRTLTQSSGTGDTGAVPETTRIVVPVPDGSYTLASPYGWRTDPVTGERAFHGGLDFAAGAGTPALAVADGVVVLTGYVGGWGNLIVLEHTIDGARVATAYAHLLDDGIRVSEGQRVTAGQHIGDIGSTGKSTGPHLHLEVRPGGWGKDTVDPAAWLADHGAAPIGTDDIENLGCAA